MSAQTLEGARKWKETMARKHGSYEKYRAVARQNASKGGKNGHTIGWAHGKADPIESGKKGGLKRKESYERNTISQTSIKR